MSRNKVVSIRRPHLRGFGGGGGGGDGGSFDADGGGVLTDGGFELAVETTLSVGELGGVGGVRGMLCGGIVDPKLGVAGVCATDELGDVATEPGGRGSEVA